jgi:penicillin-binding protein 1A
MSTKPKPATPKDKPSRMGWIKTLLKIGLFTALAGFGALVIAVLIAMASLPSFDELKSSPNGQTVR